MSAQISRLRLWQKTPAEAADQQSRFCRRRGNRRQPKSALCETQSRHIASWLSLDDFTRIGATEVDADGAIRNLSCIKGIEAAILFKEVEGGKVKISFRSTGKIDVMEVSRRFNGGGHRNAAGAQIDGKLEDVMQTVVAAVAEVLPAGDNCNA